MGFEREEETLESKVEELITTLQDLKASVMGLKEVDGATRLEAIRNLQDIEMKFYAFLEPPKTIRGKG